MSDDNGCVLSASGGVSCWGINSKGQLGDNSPASATASTAVQVQLGSAATFIAAKALSACAVLSSGAVQCWGDNTYGQLGNNATKAAGEFLPVSVAGVTAAN